ncbi:hypothetical protein KUTeg_001194 [Tegillarca granosa]|uniref:Uncharacterized protein n=1 Tax=Tegillarca granosa TaxID=220873 RepID=A0ABQ9FZ29_TEGGR|nr:hypothetical protein KUTeg_001194 [Tegillarca granosa]
MTSDKKHEPLYITPPSYRLGEEPGLATWSPYRAADQVALISMPKKMQTTVISPDRRGGGKRPIALFNDSGRPKQPEILTDEPPKPIILKTRQLMSNNKNEDKKGDHHKIQSNRGSISQTKPVFNGLESDSAGLTNMKSSSLGGSSGGVEKNKNLASSILQNRKPSHNDNRKDSVEMTTLNGDVRSRPTNPHHAPLQVIPDGIDETDIVSKNVRSNEMPKTTIQSIRNELKSTSLSTSYRPERKASSTLADIA